MNNILVTGSDGQLGSELKFLSKNYPHYKFFFVDLSVLDITNHILVKNFIINNEINIIINCAAYTAVDLAENNKDLANSVNFLAVSNFAKISNQHNIKLIHISTDYVFDGNSCLPYIETDEVNPQTVYGNTKYLGEKSICEINPSNTIIIRTSWVYSSYGNNFVKTMLRLGKEKNELDVIYDQIGSPTYARDLARSILNIIPKIKNKNVELFHYSNEGVCSWYDFSKSIFEFANIDIKVNPIESKLFSSVAKRPFFSLLNKGKIKSYYNLSIPHWRESLKNSILEFK